MLKRSVKGLCLIVAISLMSYVLVACGQNTKKGDILNTGSKEKSISVLFTKGGFEIPPGANDTIKPEIEKGSGVKFTQIAPPVANYIEKVNAILASNDLPDVVKLPAFTDLFNYADQGALMPLDDLLAKYGKDILAAIPKNVLDQCKIDGKTYGIPIWTSQHRYNFIIRGDWLKKLNLQEPKTLDDLYKVYKAFTEQDPDGNGKKDTYGLGGSGLETFDTIFGAFGLTAMDKVYWYEDNGKLLPMVLHPNMKKALEYAAKLQAEGLVDPEWVTTTTEAQLNEKAMKSQFGSTNRWWTWEPKVEQEMRKVDPNVEFRRIAPPIGPDGLSGVRGVPAVNTAIAVMKNAKDPQACMEWLNYLHTEKGMMTQYSGVEGLHWEKKSDGTYVTLPQFEVDAKWIQWYSLFENEQPLLKVETYLVQSRRDSLKWPIIVDAGDGLITKAFTKYSADLITLQKDEFTKIISGKAGISEYDNFVTQWKQNGGNEWIDEINQMYKAKK